MDDVRAVMDAVGSRRAALLGVSEGGPLCSLFAATYPERVEALAMMGTYARRLRDANYPWGTTREERAVFCERVAQGWGGPVGIEERAPSRATDRAFRAWWASYLRMGASPADAVSLTRMNAEIDVRDVLPSIRVPTLVLHRTHDRCLSVEEGRFVAERIPGARFMELPGDDHLPFVGDQDAVLDALEAFLSGPRDRSGCDRVLATVVCVSMEPGGPAETRFSAQAEQELVRFRGRALRRSPGRLIAAFDGPARAVRCAASLSTAATRAGLCLKAGLHTGECVLGAGDDDLVAGLAARLAARAEPAQVLVSRTVVDLVAGSGLRFAPRGWLRGSKHDHDWPVFAALPED